MSIAEIHSAATLTPSKDEMCAQFSDIAQRLGSYRAVDPAGEVGIEVIVGESNDGRLVQLPVTYRASSDALPGEIMTIHHSVLGSRSISYATSDPVAITEFIRLIMTGKKCADYSAGGPLFVVAGSDNSPNSTVTNPDITTYDSTHAAGTIHINGERREFSLSFPPINDAATVKDSTLALVATQPDSSFPVAYLTLS